MQVGQFPASAASSLIDGYCDDFVSLATVLAQTLEQVSVRGIKIDRSRTALERLERGMREMAEAIGELLQSGKVTNDFEVALGRTKQEPAAEPAPATPPLATAPPATPPATPRGPMPMAARGPISAASTYGPPRPAAPRVPPPGNPAPATPPPTPPPASAVPPPAPAPALRAVPPAGNRASPMRTRFESLERDRRSGTLYVQAPQMLLAFEFVHGLITQTANEGPAPGERLGDLLVELGSCKREQVTAVVARLRQDEANLLGEIMVREGAVSNRQVIEALEVQALRRIHRACNTPNPQIEFAEDQLMPEDGRLRISPTAALRQPQKPLD